MDCLLSPPTTHTHTHVRASYFLKTLLLMCILRAPWVFIMRVVPVANVVVTANVNNARAFQCPKGITSHENGTPACFSCDPAAVRTLLFVRPSVRTSNFQELLPWAKVMSKPKVKVRGQRSRSQRSKQILPQFGCYRTVIPVWIHRLLWNDTQSLK